MQKNVASQKIAFVVYDATTGLPKTGDAANLTAYVSKDGGAVTVLGDTAAAEMDSTNAKGCYLFDLAQAETNADMLVFTCKSATANIYADPILLFTEPASFNSAALATASALATVQADTDDIQTRIPAALAADGSIKASLGAVLGTAFTEGAAGRIAANLKTFFNVGSATGTQDVIPTVTTLTGNTAQTGDVYAALTGAQAEPGQGAPAANASVLTKIAYLFKGWRNKKTQTATTFSLFNDDAATVDQKATTSDDGTTATVGEVASGP
jgi:hypothetical protein